MARATSSIGDMEEKKGPTFFKMIKAGFNTEDLSISPKFWKHLWNEPLDRATLNMNSSIWTVKVSQIEGMVHFMSGWEKFVTDITPWVKEEEEGYQDNNEESAILGRFLGVIGDNSYNVALPVNLSARYFPEGCYTIVLKNSEGREVKTVPQSLEVVSHTAKLSV